MTESRIKTFLTYFYECYILTCYKGFELPIEEEGLGEKILAYDLKSYFLKHLDIYVESGDAYKEYATLYKSSLFVVSREHDPEVFNQLELFLIENIQLFAHTIVEAALEKITGKTTSSGIRLHFKPIDNKEVKLIDIVTYAEEKMKANDLLPPSMG